MQMIERVARALYGTNTHLLDASQRPFETLPESYKENWRTQARAAIEAIREPSEAQNDMLEAMWHAMFDSPFDGTSLPMLGAGFDAAIKAALQEGKED